MQKRGRKGARVYLSLISGNPNDLTKADFVILGYSDKHTQKRVIYIIRRSLD